MTRSFLRVFTNGTANDLRSTGLALMESVWSLTAITLQVVLVAAVSLAVAPSVSRIKFVSKS